MRLLLSLFLLLPILVQAQKPVPILLKEAAKKYKKAKIKTVKIYVETDEEEKFLYSTKSYNKKGELTQMENWEAGTYTWKYTYNKLGLLEKETMEDAGENILEEVSYIYGKKNRLIEINYKNKEYPYSLAYSYDKKGRIDSSFVKDLMPQKTAWTYDSKNRVISQTKYSILSLNKPNEWKEEDKDLYEYDAQGNVKKVTASFKGKDIYYTAVYKYNSKNEKIQFDEYNSESKQTTTLYEYNESGFLIKEIFRQMEGDVKKTSTYEYEYQ